MRKLQLILLLYIGWITTLSAQDNQDEITDIVLLGSGTTYTQVKRTVVSDFQHSGFSYPSLYFGYTRPSENWQQEVQIYFHYARLRSPFIINYSTDTRGELLYSFYKKVWDAHRLKLWTGGIVNLTLNLHDYKANEVDRGNAQAHLFMTSVGGMIRGEYQLPKGELLAEMQWLPFALNRRAGYANKFSGVDAWFNNARNGNLESTSWELNTLGIYKDASLQVTYRFPLTWNTDMDIQYSVRYLSFTTPEFYGYLRQSLGVIFRFMW